MMDLQIHRIIGNDVTNAVQTCHVQSGFKAKIRAKITPRDTYEFLDKVWGLLVVLHLSL